MGIRLFFARAGPPAPDRRRSAAGAASLAATPTARSGPLRSNQLLPPHGPGLRSESGRRPLALCTLAAAVRRCCSSSPALLRPPRGLARRAGHDP